MERFSHWKRISIGTTFCVTAHPDLGTCQISDNGHSVTLLGFILDPNNPAATDLDIISGLLSHFQLNDDLDAVVETTYTFGGRWILILDNGREARLFHDAAGLRQVFYTRFPSAETNWCASDPGVIAGMLGLSEDHDAHAFITSLQTVQQRTLVARRQFTVHDPIRRLLPNHYLDLHTAFVSQVLA